MERYNKKSKIKRIKTKKGILFAEIISNPSGLEKNEREKLAKDIRELVTRCWGDFGESFFKVHVLNSIFLFMLFDKEKLIGLASISEKKVLNRKIYYFELTVIDSGYRSLGLSETMNLLLARRVFLKEILRGRLSLECMVITPNVRVLGTLARFASFIYPDPSQFNKGTHMFPEPDNQTWEMAQDLIKKSDYPGRKIIKNGCVLIDSYKDTPWLIYDDENLPHSNDEALNEIGKIYLGYGKKEDKEFIVRAKFHLKSLLKGF